MIAAVERRVMPFPTATPARILEVAPEPLDAPPLPRVETFAPEVLGDVAEPPPGAVGPEIADETTPGVTLPVRHDGAADPPYPELARIARKEGVVVLRAVVRTDGTVGDVRVVRAPPGDLGFAAAAADTVRTWIYEPGRLDGSPIGVEITVVVTFTLR